MLLPRIICRASKLARRPQIEQTSPKAAFKRRSERRQDHASNKGLLAGKSTRSLLIRLSGSGPEAAHREFGGNETKRRPVNEGWIICPHHDMRETLRSQDSHHVVFFHPV